MTSTISPESGAITSETALTDSTSASRPSVDLGADLGRVVEDDLAEAVLGVAGDAEHGVLVALQAGPVVLVVVEQLVWVAGVGQGQLSFREAGLAYRGLEAIRAARRLPRTSISTAMPDSARSARR